LAADSKPDIILVTETWCNSNVSNAYLNIPGYQIQPDLRSDRKDTANGIGGGLLVYNRDGLDILPGDNSAVFNQYVTFKIFIAKVTTTICLVYRPPNSTDMDGLANLIKNAPPNSILIGDFNLPGIDWETGTATGRAREILEAAEERFFEQLVDFPTHTKGNTLDLVLTNSSEMVCNISPEGRLGKSDHEMLLIELLGSQTPTQCPMQKPDWNKANWDAMRYDLGSCDWYQLLNNLNTEAAWAEVRSALEDVTNRYVPPKRQRPPNRPIWMTKEISSAMARKRRLWRKNGQNDEYREAEKKVRNLIRNAKRNFEKKLAKSNGNSKPFYSYLKNKTQSRSGIGPLLGENNILSTDSKEMADILNKYFSSVFSADDSQGAPQDVEQHEAPQLDNIQIRVSDTRKLIRDLKTAGSPGPDKITARLLQQVAWEIAPALTIVFRKSLASGDVPADWRLANVTPIFKKGKKADPGNYRPVSLTSICGKLMEAHLKREITNHLKIHRLLRSSQHGFLKGKSCTTNLLHFLDVLTKAADEGKNMDVIFLDFSKAFDKVPHRKLIQKLEGHRIGGKVSRWIRNWLRGRTQRVVINGESSEPQEVKSGVPQGSLLGPVLFSVYLNDIDLIVELITLLIKFADDTKLAHEIRNEEDRKLLQQCLDELMAWAARWGMAFNTAKCKVMHVGRHNPQFDYKMGDHTLEKTTVERDIGVLVNSNLKPADQCAKAATTANAVLGQISGDKNYHERLSELGMTTLQARREETDMVEVFKILTGISDVDPQTWFTMNAPAEGGRVTRLAADPLNVKLAPARLELRKNFFSVRTCEKWNNLPSAVKSSKNVKQFKMAYKRHLESPPAQARAARERHEQL